MGRFQKVRDFHRRGFSMVELMVVIAIIAALAGLLLPAVQKVRVHARRLESSNNLKQMALAAQEWHNIRQVMPPALGWANAAGKRAQNDANGTFFFMLLPYLEAESLYATSLDGNGFAYRANNITYAQAAQPKVFRSKLDASRPYYSNFGVTSYLANRDLLDKRYTLNQIPDGSSNTILIAEGNSTCYGPVWDKMSFYTTSSGDSDPYYPSGGRVSVPGYQSPNAFGTPYWSGPGGGRINFWNVGTEVSVYSCNSSGACSWTTVNKVKAKDYSAVDFTVTPVDLTPAKTVDVTPQAAGGSYIGNDAIPIQGNAALFFKNDTHIEPLQLVSTAQVLDPVTHQLVPQQHAIPARTHRSTFQMANAAGVSTLNAQGYYDCWWFAPQAFAGSLQVAMADGSVHGIDPGVSPESWNAAITPDGGEVFETDLFN